MTIFRTLSAAAVFLSAAGLLPAQAPVMTRVPYLQMPGETAISICWRTGVAGTGTVRYGTAPDALTAHSAETAAAVDHHVRLTGLTPGTKYYYSVETDGTVHAAGTGYFFRTSPAVAAAESVRFWALGDCGTAGVAVRWVRDAFVPLHAERRADLVLLLGDNAYGSGTDAQYQAAIFDVFPDFLREVPFWSCLGNHETYAGFESNGKYAYENIFRFPVAGECGGVASGSERYYSWDYGNVHFISLDSETSSRAADGPMAQWLVSDLQANTKPWTVALWHSPPYTKGSHNSDVEGPLVQMRQNILPVLESHGVDLVLCGHSHSYERSYLLDGHYGLSTDLHGGHKKNGGDGRESGTGPYYKAGAGMTPREGAVYIVAGSSGQISGGTLNHPAHFVSLNRLGSVVVDVNGLRMDVKFLREKENAAAPLIFDDSFTIIKGTPPPQPVITRGPYLQKASPTQITIRWRTGTPVAAVVRYGTAPDALTLLASVPGPAGTDHSVRLQGLTPATKYWYSIEANGYTLTLGNDFHFTTPPPPDSTGPVRVWVLGDAGTQSDEQRQVRDAFRALHEQQPANLWLMLGDNAYGSGTDAEYQGAVFDMYHPWLQQVPLWSCIGNHETYDAADAQGRFAYDHIFDFPTAGECGGVASGTERYYSWDYGNIHFVTLDSATSNRLAAGPMAQWLAADLAANTKTWTVVCFHHPPYTKGTHDSDWEEEHIEMRENIIPILEQFGVDLVLGGHSHVYERSYFLKGHYGDSTTFTGANKVDGGDGREDGDGAYRKFTGTAAAQNGTVYVVAGSSGQYGGGELNHPAHFSSQDLIGSLVLDVQDHRMDVRFLNGQTHPNLPPFFSDHFTLKKGVPPLPAAPDGLLALPLDATHAALHWTDNSTAEDGFEIQVSVNGGPFETVTAVPENSTGTVISGLAANAACVFRVVASNASGTAASGDHAWTHIAPGSPVPPVAVWRFIYWGSTDAGGERADDANPDGDSLTNLMEYALGSPPLRAMHTPGFAITQAPGGMIFTFARTAAADLTYTVEFSPDMAPGTWTAGFTSTGAANLAGIVSVPVPTEAGKQFVRLRVTLNP